MRKNSLRILSLMTALVMTFSSVNVTAFADEITTDEYVISEESTEVNSTLADEDEGNRTSDDAMPTETFSEETTASEETTVSEAETVSQTEELEMEEYDTNVRAVDKDITANTARLIQSRYYQNADGKYDIFFYVAFPTIARDTDLELCFAGASFGDSSEVKYADNYEGYEVSDSYCSGLNFRITEYIIHDVSLQTGSVDYKFYLFTYNESLANQINGYIKGSFTADTGVVDYRLYEGETWLIYDKEGSTVYPEAIVELDGDDYINELPVLVDSDGAITEVDDFYINQSFRGGMDVSDSRYNYGFEYNSTTYTLNDWRSQFKFRSRIEIPFDELAEGKYDIMFTSRKGKTVTYKNAIEIAKTKIIVKDVATANPGTYSSDCDGDYMPVAVYGVNIPDDLIPEFYTSSDFDPAKKAAVYDITDPKCTRSMDFGNGRIYMVKKTNEIKNKFSGDLYLKFASNAVYDSKVLFYGDNTVTDAGGNAIGIKGSYKVNEINRIILEKGTNKRLLIYLSAGAFSENPVGDILEVLSTTEVYDDYETVIAAYTAIIQCDANGEYYAEVPGNNPVYLKLVNGGTGTVGYGNWSYADKHTAEGWMMRFNLKATDAASEVTNINVKSGNWVLKYPDMREFKSGTAGSNLLTNSEVLACSKETHMVLEVNDNGKYSYSVLRFKSPVHDTVVFSNEGENKTEYLLKGEKLTLAAADVPTQYAGVEEWKNNHTFKGWYDINDVNHTKKIETITAAGGKTTNLVAYWEPTTYDIYFDGEDGVRARVAYDGSVELTAALCEEVKPGYKVAGVEKAGSGAKLFPVSLSFQDCTYFGTLDEANKTINFKKKWEVVDYTVTYHLAGVEATIGNQYKSYNINSEDITLPVITGAELDFAGWYLDKEYSEDKKITKIVKGSTGNLDIYAKWVNPTYTIKFDGNISQYSDAAYAKNNKVMSDIAGKKTGELVNLPASTYSLVSTKTTNPDTWVFVGWSTSQAGPVKYTDKGTASFRKADINSNNEVILYAVYSNTLKVAYNLDGGYFEDGRTEDTFNYNGNKTITLETPKKSGFDFLGWYDDNGKKVSSVSSKNTGTYTLTARWKERVYKLKLNANGGKGKAVTITVPYTGYVDLTDYENDYSRAGYKLKGWNMNPDSDPTQPAYWSFKPTDVTGVLNYKSGTTFTIKAKWILVDNTIDYYDAKEKEEEEPYCFGHKTYQLSTTDLELMTPTKSGFTFAGWYYDWGTYKKPAGTFKDGKSMLKKGTSGNIKLYAKWTKEYKLVLHTDPSDYTKTEEYAGCKYDIAKAIPASKYKQAGKTVVGWAVSEADANNKKRTYITGDKILRNSANLNSNNELHLYAIWAVSKYTIVYIDNSVYPAKEIRQVATAGKTVTLRKNTFKRQGFGFVGWDTYSAPGVPAEYDDCAKVDFTLDSKLVDNEMKLYAVFDTTFLISFDKNANDATISRTVLRYRYGNEINEKVFAGISVPSKTGYVFSGWYTDPECKKAFKKISKTQVGNFWLYAKWTPANYTITFDPNVPEGAKLTGKMNPQKRTYLKEAMLSRNSYKLAGYVFKGWSESPIGSKQYDDGQKIVGLSDGFYSENRTLYAKWEAIDYKITYNNMTGFDNPNATTYITADGLTLKEPERLGYTFIGWYSDKACKKQVTEIKPGTVGNITLYAKWVLN